MTGGVIVETPSCSSRGAWVPSKPQPKNIYRTVIRVNAQSWLPSSAVITT